MTASRPATAALLVALAALAPAARAQTGFQAGDLILYAPSYPVPGSASGAVLRIDPFTGSVSVLVDLQTSSGGPDPIAYDPFRDRLIFFGGDTINHNEVFLCDAAGNLQSLGLGAAAGPTLGSFAPRGDGLIYFRGHNSPQRIQYFDAADGLNTLMDAAGAAPFAFPPSVAFIRYMHHDAPTNALFVATTNGATACAGGSSDAANLHRLELSADGARVVGVSCFQFDLAPGAFGEVPVGLSAGPGGDLLLTLDDNSSNTLPRMVRVDPHALTAVPFASNGGGVVGGGCYSQARARAVLGDNFDDVLRLYAEGESGSGAVLATGLGVPSGTGESMVLVEIGPAATAFGMRADVGAVSVSAGGTQSWRIELGAAHAGELYLVLGSFSGWNPGFPVDGQLVPLQLDAYLLYTLQAPNLAPLVGSLGLLDAGGGATGAFALPPAAPAGLVGVTAHHATLAFGPLGTVDAVTNPVALTFLP